MPWFIIPIGLIVFLVLFYIKQNHSEHLESDTAGKNKDYVNAEIVRCALVFDDIDGKSLDRQQREAVVIQENNQLVLAGAGSGKTLTISANVKYLVDELKYKPKEVLLISFTKNSAEEMWH